MGDDRDPIRLQGAHALPPNGSMNKQTFIWFSAAIVPAPEQNATMRLVTNGFFTVPTGPLPRRTGSRGGESGSCGREGSRPRGRRADAPREQRCRRSQAERPSPYADAVGRVVEQAERHEARRSRSARAGYVGDDGVEDERRGHEPACRRIAHRREQCERQPLARQGPRQVARRHRVTPGPEEHGMSSRGPVLRGARGGKRRGGEREYRGVAAEAACEPHPNGPRRDVEGRRRTRVQALERRGRCTVPEALTGKRDG